MKLYRVSEVSQITGFSEAKIRRISNANDIPGMIRVGQNNERLFSDESVKSLLKIGK